MMPFAGTDELSPPQVTAIIHAMLRIARVDEAGTQEEIALIRTFYEGGARDPAMPSFQSLLEQAGAAPGLDAGLFPQPAQRDLVLSLCLMVAYADGTLSAGEHDAVADLARELGVAAEHLEDLLTQLKDHLLARLSRLPDAASVAKVAAELH